MIETFYAETEFRYHGKFCQIRIDHLPKGFDQHTHDYTEIVIVLKGSANHVINGQSYHLEVGTVHVVQGQVVHGFSNPDENFTIYNIAYQPGFLPEDLLRTMAGYQALFVLEPAWRQQREYTSQMIISGGELSSVIDHVRCLQQEIIDHAAGYDCMLQAGFIQLIVMLSRMYEQQGRPRQLLHLSNAIARMETNFCEQLSVDELASLAHMSRRHFFRAFREIYDQSPMDYVMSLRIREAARLLLNRPDLSIGQISHETGFSDSNYFSRQFRRHYSCSPRQYRKNKA